MVKKLLKLTFICLFFLFLSSQPALAQSEFSSRYTVDYTIRPNGITHTQFNISLTNKLSNIYASEFSLSIGSTQLQAIKAYNQQGDLETKIIQGNKTTNIVIPFKDKVLGKNKSQVFTLEFDSLDFAHQLGSIWEISIPRLSKTDSLDSYQLTLSVPDSFGQPATFSPQPSSQTSADSYTVYRFRQDDLFDSGISATFGQTQYFNFALQYHLNNSNIYQIKTEIALPPDTAFQKLIYQTLDPQPTNITLDPDGNWLATYVLSPKQTLRVLATGSAQINLHPRADFPRYPLTSSSDYLQTQKYWEVDNPRIQELAQELRTPQKIYQYVVDNLIYDYGRLSDTTTRFGAANALDNQDSAICMEFTDLFIALSRAVGVPARAVNGFAYTTNSQLRPLSLKKDVLHAWPEYYDSQKHLWIPIDPTWGNTTGGVDFFNQTDLNHFAFAFLGQDSNYPVPAGAYKLKTSQTKDVEVNFGQSAQPHPQTQIEINLPDRTIAGMPISGQIILKNTGNVAVYNQQLQLTSDHFSLPQDSWTIPQLPPFANHVINFELPATGWNDNLTDNLTAVSDMSQAQHQLILLPVYLLITTDPKFKLFLILAPSLTLSFFLIKSLLKRQKQSS
jgi:transglutaminase-like putative cysteine protease